MTPEGKTKKIIKEWAKTKGIVFYNIIPNSIGNTVGFPDMYIHLPPNGRAFYIEAKAEGKRNNLSPHQKDFREKALAAGALHYVVSCQQDLDEMEEELTTLGVL